MTTLDNKINDNDSKKKESGLKEKEGLKIWDYLSLSYRYYCGKCVEEIGRDGKCNCGWFAPSFRATGL